MCWRKHSVFSNLQPLVPKDLPQAQEYMGEGAEWSGCPTV